MEFNRYDICEAYACIWHDWGDYSIGERYA